MRRAAVRCWAAAALIAASGAFEVHAGPSPEEDIRRWVRDLDDDSFHAREEACRQLIRSGKAAVKATAAAATSESPEVTRRAIEVLAVMSKSGEDASAAAANEALRGLAASKHLQAARGARQALLGIRLRTAAILEKSGAAVSFSGDTVVSVNLDRAELTPRTFALLREFPDLKSVSLSNPLMNDSLMAELRDLPNLGHLNLYASGVGDDGLKYLKRLPALRSVPMGGTQVTDAGLVHLRDLTELEYVGLRGDQVTDAGLVHLRGLTNLSGLHLGETLVTDAGLVHLRGMTRMQNLRLGKTRVTDAGLDHFFGMTDLRSLELSDTRVTEAGLVRLRKKLPQLQVSEARP